MIPEQHLALDLARRCIQQTNRSLFLTGRAGTGKTTFLREIVAQTHKNVMVVAPTGVAAINAGGATIHSVFQLPFGMFLPVSQLPSDLDLPMAVNTPQTLIRHMQMAERKRNLIRELELLIIDEVSMLRADLLDAVDAVLRYVRKRPGQPFGGVQVLFIGDLLQLPPVVKPEEWNLLKSHYKSIYFFDAKVIREAQPLYIELETVYRQTDGRFLDLLNNLRENALTPADIRLLNSYYRPGFVPPKEDLYITLTSHNYKADAINTDALQRIDAPSYFYGAAFDGDFPEHACPVETELELRVGAQVMFVKNDPTGQQRYFNGKIGTVTELDDGLIVVNCDDAELVVEPYVWRNIRYQLNDDTHVIEETELGSFTQYPLKLAWAITVHKSQGLTFDRAVLDIGEAFASGQTYVALSRLRSLDGLVLLSTLSAEGIATDKDVLHFAGAQRRSPDVLEAEIGAARMDYLRQYLLRAYDLDDLVHKFRVHRDSYTKDEVRSAKQKYKPWADAIAQDLVALQDVGIKFQRALQQLFSGQQDFPFEIVLERTRSAAAYFKPQFDAFIGRVRAQHDLMRTESQVRKYQTELQGLESALRRTLQQIGRTDKLVEAFRDNADPDKSLLGIGVVDPERLREKPDQRTDRRTKRARPAAGDTEKMPKVSTYEVTWQLYEEGLTPAEIAVKRTLALSTIEGHLARLVAQGKLDAEKLIAAERLEEVLQAIADMDTSKLGHVKEALGEAYSFSEIRLALAYRTHRAASDAAGLPE